MSRQFATLTTTALFAALMATGCMFSPTNESTTPDRDALIAFEGLAAETGKSIDVVAARSPSGPFTDVIRFETEAAFEWGGSSAIPRSLWQPMCDEVGGWETFVRAEDAFEGGPYGTFDHPSISGFDGETCVASHVAAGDYYGALFNCLSPDTPIVRLYTAAGGTGPATIEGDVLIDDPSDVDAVACAHTIDGSLVIDDGVVEDLAFPNLEVVTGDVTIVYDRPDDPVWAAAEDMIFPVLHSVGGSLDLYSPNPPAQPLQIATVGLGFEALTSVGASVEIVVDSFNTSLSGFAQLASIPGSVVLQTGTDDSGAGGLFPALTSIGGDLDATFGSSTTDGFFGTLETIGGNATIEGGNWIAPGGVGSMFDAVTDVAGTLHVIGVHLHPVPAPRAFDALESVGGFDWESGGDFAGLGSVAIETGGLRLHDNDWLTDLDTTMAAWTITPNASIEITDNPILPTCDAQAWVDGLMGHVGPVTISGNAACGRVRDLGFTIESPPPSSRLTTAR